MLENKSGLATQISKVQSSWPKVSKARMAAAKNYMSKMSPTRYQFLGMQVPVVRESLKKIEFHRYSLDEQMAQVDLVWATTDTFEVGCLCLYWLDKQPTDFLLGKLAFLKRWAKRIDNWAHSDYFCSVIARLNEANPKSMGPILSTWSKAKSPWLNRLSLVGLLYYSRMRKRVPPCAQLLTAIATHLGHSDYYVGKAVGWTVRETYNVYPKDTLQFILLHAHRFHPSGWYAVTEKLSTADKKKALNARKGY